MKQKEILVCNTLFLGVIIICTLQYLIYMIIYYELKFFSSHIPLLIKAIYWCHIRYSNIHISRWESLLSLEYRDFYSTNISLDFMPFCFIYLLCSTFQFTFDWSFFWYIFNNMFMTLENSWRISKKLYNYALFSIV